MSAGSFACETKFTPVPELGVQGVVSVDLDLCGDIWSARDVGCPGLILFILNITLSTTDRPILLDLPINRLTGTQPPAAIKLFVGLMDSALE